MNNILKYLTEEKKLTLAGGLYQTTQVAFALNSHNIAKERVNEQQVQHIFDSRFITDKEEDVAVDFDDMIEISNHFTAFDYVLDSVNEPLSVQIIRELHRMLKMNTTPVARGWLILGQWKRLSNKVEEAETTPPKSVNTKINSLNEWYNSLPEIGTEHIIEYHYRFEKIHPFQAGSGRVGRLLMFRECLRNNIMPFIIKQTQRKEYYLGFRDDISYLPYLSKLCAEGQEQYTNWVKYFYGEV